MPVTILSNKANTSTVIHITSNSTTVGNASLVIVGNSTVSNIATTNEILTGGTIRKATWGIDGAGASIQILRGANSIATCTGSYAVDYAGMGMPLTKDPGATLNVNFVGSSNGYIMLEVAKQGVPR